MDLDNFANPDPFTNISNGAIRAGYMSIANRPELRVRED